MAIPKAVEAAAKRADELMQRQAGTTPEAAPANEQQAPAAAASETPSPAPEPEAGRPAIPDAPEPKDWEQKYRVLQGKYNHEVPRLQQEARQLKGELSGMREEIDRLKSQPKVEAPVAIPSNLKPEEIEQYGPDFVDFMKRVAASVAPQPVKNDTSSLEQRVQSAEEVARVAVQRQFFADLTERVPNWQQLNTDEKFLLWLDEVDPMTGSPRQVMFDHAYSQLDVNRVSAFFKAFGGSNVGAAPSGGPPAGTMVTPSTSRGAPEMPQGKKIWRQREVGEFYANLRTGKISAEDAARTELEIFAAQNEGRIK